MPISSSVSSRLWIVSGLARLVGQVVVDLVEGQEPPPFAQVEERLEALVQLFHPESSLTHGTTDQDASLLRVRPLDHES